MIISTLQKFGIEAVDTGDNLFVEGEDGEKRITPSKIEQKKVVNQFGKKAVLRCTISVDN